MYYNKYRKIKDIYSVPCMKRLDGKKAIAVTGNHALVQYTDGARWYYRKNEWSLWECIREELFTNA